MNIGFYFERGVTRMHMQHHRTNKDLTDSDSFMAANDNTDVCWPNMASSRPLWLSERVRVSAPRDGHQAWSRVDWTLKPRGLLHAAAPPG